MGEPIKTRKHGRAAFHKVYEEGEKAAVKKFAEMGISGDVRSQLKMLLKGLIAKRDGDFSVRMPVIEEEEGMEDGLIVKIFEAFNENIIISEKLSEEIGRVCRAVGEEGKLTERAEKSGFTGIRAKNLDEINSLINNLAQPTNAVGQVISAVAEGNLSKKMPMEIDGKPLKGEFLRIGSRVNTMVDQLNAFASEVTRVATEDRESHPY